MGKENNGYPKSSEHKLLMETITANSITEFNERFKALGILDPEHIGIRAEVRAINRIEIDNAQCLLDMLEKRGDTIRRLRREIRHLRSLLKTKDRLLASQKSFYEAMLDDVQKRKGTSKESVEEWFAKMLQNAVKNLGL